jgi:hypothetical protein
VFIGCEIPGNLHLRSAVFFTHICTVVLVNLERVCKQLRQETKLLPYAPNNFYFSTPEQFMRWSGNLSSEAKSKIRWARFETFFWADDIDGFFLELSTFPNLEKIAFQPFTAEENLQEFEEDIAKRGGKWKVVRGAEWYSD